MKSVLISIQPKWCELIANKNKSVEIRKTKPKIDTPFKCYIYQTKKPVSVSFSGTGRHISEYDKTCYYNERSGKVIGEFVCDKITMSLVGYNTDGLPSYWDILDGSCLTPNELVCYGEWKILYGWHISDLVIYDEPKELSEFVTHCKYEFDDDFEHCENCQHYYYSNTPSCGIEEYCGCDGLKPVTRPPQSWCYVEERSA